MAGRARVHILDPTGSRSLEATIDDQKPLGESLPALAARFGYPRDRIDGEPVGYHLYHREGKAVVDPDATLPGTGIQDGHTLVYFPAREGPGGTG